MRELTNEEIRTGATMGLITSRQACDLAGIHLRTLVRYRQADLLTTHRGQDPGGRMTVRLDVAEVRRLKSALLTISSESVLVSERIERLRTLMTQR